MKDLLQSKIQEKIIRIIKSKQKNKKQKGYNNVTNRTVKMKPTGNSPSNQTQRYKWVLTVLDKSVKILKQSQRSLEWVHKLRKPTPFGRMDDLSDRDATPENHSHSQT